MQPSTHVQHEDRRPFLALGGMDGGEDQVVLVELRHAGLVAGGVRRVERQLGQEALARRDSRTAICSSCRRSAARTSAHPRGCARDAARTRRARARVRPASPSLRIEPADQRGEGAANPAAARAAAPEARTSAATGSAASAMRVEQPAGRGRADARHELQHAEAGDAVARVLRQAQAARARP